MPPGGLEPPTCGLGNRSLTYGHVVSRSGSTRGAVGRFNLVGDHFRVHFARGCAATGIRLARPLNVDLPIVTVTDEMARGTTRPLTVPPRVLGSEARQTPSARRLETSDQRSECSASR
jgi:hypothetical protein